MRKRPKVCHSEVTAAKLLLHFGNSQMTVRYSQLIFSAIIWGLFLIAYIGFGYTGSGTPLLPDALTRLTTAGNQFATTDAFLKILKLPRPSETIQAAVAGLPSGDPLLVVGSSNDPTLESRYCVISYLSWPRQVYLLVCGEPRRFKGIPALPERLKTAGVLFYRMEPPSALPGGSALGPSLKLVPTSETLKWTSYCF
jgi:hypothetical protein